MLKIFSAIMTLMFIITMYTTTNYVIMIQENEQQRQQIEVLTKKNQKLEDDSIGNINCVEYIPPRIFLSPVYEGSLLWGVNVTRSQREYAYLLNDLFMAIEHDKSVYESRYGDTGEPYRLKNQYFIDKARYLLRDYHNMCEQCGIDKDVQKLYLFLIIYLARYTD